MRVRHLAGLALWALVAGVSGAHEFSITDVLVVLKTDGTFQIDMTVDVDALALGVAPSTDSADNVARLEAMSAAELETTVERARATILRRVRARFDGREPEAFVDFPGRDLPFDDPLGLPSVLGTTARISGRLPAGARRFSFGASRAFGPVQLTVLEQSTAMGVRHLLGPGEDSPAHALGAPPEMAARRTVAGRYLILGFEHILPLGVDHILFVVGLFLLSNRLQPLVWQISAFTVAHTLSLGLSMAGLITLPSRLVESAIALSIAYVAIENLFTAELKPWRPALVFAFGLLHGLGFAGVLRELGLPEGEFLVSLLAFNVGVELGQLGVVLLAFAAVGWAANRPWYRNRVVRPASAVIAAVGLWWAAERALALG